MEHDVGPEPVAPHPDPNPADGIDEDPDANLHTNWASSIKDVMREVITALPEHTSLGEIVEATRNNPQMAPVMAHLSVQDLIDLACEREREAPLDDELDDAAVSSTVIRRRADVPGGDTLVLQFLQEQGPATDSSITRATQVAAEQLRLLLRSLTSKGFVHVEGRGPKKRTRITRSGATWLNRGSKTGTRTRRGGRRKAQ